MDNEELLKVFLASAKSGEYKNFDELYNNFPEFKNTDKKVLQTFLASADSGEYTNFKELYNAFPELNGKPAKSAKSISSRNKGDNQGLIGTSTTTSEYSPFINDKYLKDNNTKSSSSNSTDLTFIDSRDAAVNNIMKKYDNIRDGIKQKTFTVNKSISNSNERFPFEPKGIAQESTRVDNIASLAQTAKDVSDFAIQQQITPEELASLTPSEYFRVSRGEHAYKVDKEAIRLINDPDVQMRKFEQKAYAVVTAPRQYMHDIGENVKIGDLSYEAAMANVDATEEHVYRNIEGKYLNNYLGALTVKQQQLDATVQKLLTPDEQEILKSQETYTNGISNNDIPRDIQYEQKLSNVYDKLNKANIVNQATILSENYKEYKAQLDNLPIKYKIAAAADKSQRLLQEARDDQTRDHGAVINTLSVFGDALYSALERNLLKGIPNTITSLEASFGWDKASSALLVEAQQPSILGLTATKYERPTHEKTAFYTDPNNGGIYEIAFDDKNNITNIYDTYGLEAKLSDIEKSNIATNVENSKLYTSAKNTFNTESLLYKGLSTTLDVLATIGYTYATGQMLKGLAPAGGVIAEAGALPEAVTSEAGTVGIAKLLPTSSGLKTYASDVLSQSIPIMGQFWGNSTVDAVRSGQLTPMEAAWYGGVMAMQEILVEGINPLAGRLGRGVGRLAKVSESLSNREMLNLMGKYSTRAARQRALVTWAYDMVGENGEEILSNYLQPEINKTFNKWLGSDLDESSPTLNQNLETIAITSIATLIPATLSAVHDYKYLTSEKFYKESLFKAADRKYKNSLTDYISNLVGKGTITEEEANRFNNMITTISAKKEAVDNLGNKTKEAQSLREDVIALYAYVDVLSNKKSNDSKLDTSLDLKIDKANKLINRKIDELSKMTTSDIVQTEGQPDIATNQDNQVGKSGGIMGEDNISPTQSKKEKQLEIIKATNPAPDNNLLWARTVDDIKTADEAFQTAFKDGAMYEDFTVDDMKSSLESGEVIVYSSYPITEGVFVSPSKMNAQEYAGGKKGKIYSKKVKLDDIAWLDEGDGQYAPVSEAQTKPIKDDTNNTISDAVASTETVDVGKQSTVSEEVGKGNSEAQKATEQSSQKEEALALPTSNELQLDLNKLPTDKVGRLAHIKAALQDKGFLEFINDKGEPC